MRGRLPEVISHITKEGTMHDINRRRIALMKAKIAELEEWETKNTQPHNIRVSTRKEQTEQLEKTVV